MTSIACVLHVLPTTINTVLQYYCCIILKNKRHLADVGPAVRPPTAAQVSLACALPRGTTDAIDRTNPDRVSSAENLRPERERREGYAIGFLVRCSELPAV